MDIKTKMIAKLEAMKHSDPESRAMIEEWIEHLKKENK